MNTEPTAAAQAVLREHLLLMARYEHWATQQLLGAVDALSEADYRRDQRLFFKSVHGTLNHLLVTGTALWAPRFAEGRSPRLALDAELETDRGALRSRLLAGAALWEPLVERASAATLASTLTYRRLSGEVIALPWSATLMHVFNHGTHHRGQISAALTALGQDGPVLDLLQRMRQEAAERA